MPSLLHTHRLLLLCLLSLTLSGCRTVGGFYNCPRPASFYVKRYCFELPKQKVSSTVQWLLKRYQFPPLNNNPKEGNFSTQTIHMPRFSCGSRWGYTVGLNIKVREYRGKISLKGLPKWAFAKKPPPIPSSPERAKYPNAEAYQKALDDYQKALLLLVSAQNKVVQMMKQWQGCDIKKSTLRTVVEINSNILAYPTNTFGGLKKDKKIRRVKSRLQLEYSMLRMLGWKLGRLRYMRRLLK